MTQLHLNLICYSGAFALALLLTPILIRIAKRFGIVDAPGVRKVHRVAVPRVGGISIAMATATPFIIALFTQRPDLLQPGSDSFRIIALILAAFSVMLLGFADDVRNIPAVYKLGVILLASGFFCHFGAMIRTITFDGHKWLDLGVFAYPVTIIWLIGVTVSINFIDGLDGLAAGIVAIACCVLAVGSAIGGYPLPILLTFSLLGALTGFLIFNIHPARLFMGDSGSMFIGFALAALCVLSNRAIGSTRAIMLPALTLSIPLLDTFFTMIRRGIIQRRSLFAPERGHVHHRLLDAGLRHPHAVILLHLITLLAAVVAMVVMFARPLAGAVFVTAFAVFLLLVFRAVGTTRARETISSIRRNRQISRDKRLYRNAFYNLQLGFREVETVDAWCEQLRFAAQQLAFSQLELSLTRRDGSSTKLSWRHNERELSRGDSLFAEVPVVTRRAGESLRVEVELDKGRYLEISGYRLALFAELIGEYGLDKIPVPPIAAVAGSRARIISAQTGLNMAVDRLDQGDANIATV
jgi:UDP-GlcNAc:undecaprenyl-phosphate/decaprenyl-phosphate GlcNAc-1-phosphate transferase